MAADTYYNITKKLYHTANTNKYNALLNFLFAEPIIYDPTFF